MDRKYIVVGDAPACGGSVLSFTCRPSDTINGHQKALVGGRVFCGACDSIGFIAKAGGPYRPRLCDAELALEGDVVECRCPVPPVLVSTLQNFASCDDRGGIQGRFDSSCTIQNWYSPDPEALTSSKRVVAGFVKNDENQNVGDRFCPDQTNTEFFDEIFKNRDRAIYLIKRKLNELMRWDQSAQENLKLWFGKADEEIRAHLQAGLTNTVHVLADLTKNNFARYSDDFAAKISCTPDPDPAAVAGVCKSDTKNKIIGIAFGFCKIPTDSGSVDSKLGTLIHEVTHFDDVFGTVDHMYHYKKSLELARTDSTKPRNNADSITGYIMWETYFGI